MRALFVMLVLALAACGDDDGSADAGDAGDAAFDAFDSGFDAASACPLSCVGFEICCVVDGEPTCVDSANDGNHCGRCGVVCAEGRGERCERSNCVCGGVDIGCLGDRTSTCCMPRVAGGSHYGGNVEQDFRDCGGCGEGCDIARADRCEGGSCRCGLSREQCAGTADETCCVDVFGDAGCVDLELNHSHCGECEHRCRLSESCIDGECIAPPTDGGVDAGDAATGDAGTDATVHDTGVGDAAGDGGADAGSDVGSDAGAL